MRVLICDYDASTVLDLWWLLHEQGHSICGVVRDADRCMEKVVQTRPDLVMVDQEMWDGSTGSHVASTLEQAGVLSVVLTDDPQTVPAVTPTKVVLKKPFSEALLATAMARVARGQALRAS